MTNSTTEILRNNIKKYRLSLNFTQEQLSEYSGISSDYLSEIERGKKIPSLKRIELIAKALKIEVYKLFVND
ncbi:MAG: helix-turn-helix transcriptional regulator [bacterium]|nr:helix-turn-helix transcriptional regulator [bacterium]